MKKYNCMHSSKNNACLLGLDDSNHIFISFGCFSAIRSAYIAPMVSAFLFDFVHLIKQFLYPFLLLFNAWVNNCILLFVFIITIHTRTINPLVYSVILLGLNLAINFHCKCFSFQTTEQLFSYIESNFLFVIEFGFFHLGNFLSFVFFFFK